MRGFLWNGGQLLTRRAGFRRKEQALNRQDQWPCKWLSWSSGGHCTWRSHKQAPPAAAQMCSLWSLAVYKPLLVVGRKGSRRGLLPLLLILPSDMQAHTAAEVCRLHSHIRQASAFFSCSLYAVTPLLTCLICLLLKLCLGHAATWSLSLPAVTVNRTLPAPAKCLWCSLMSANHFEFMRT